MYYCVRCGYNFIPCLCVSMYYCVHCGYNVIPCLCVSMYYCVHCVYNFIPCLCVSMYYCVRCKIMLMMVLAQFLEQVKISIRNFIHILTIVARNTCNCVEATAWREYFFWMTYICNLYNVGVCIKLKLTFILELFFLWQICLLMYIAEIISL
jgi:hypothetical protein